MTGVVKMCVPAAVAAVTAVTAGNITVNIKALLVVSLSSSFSARLLIMFSFFVVGLSVQLGLFQVRDYIYYAMFCG